MINPLMRFAVLLNSRLMNMINIHVIHVNNLCTSNFGGVTFCFLNW